MLINDQLLKTNTGICLDYIMILKDYNNLLREVVSYDTMIIYILYKVGFWLPDVQVSLIFRGPLVIFHRMVNFAY